jgi:hypothetical protein
VNTIEFILDDCIKDIRKQQHALKKFYKGVVER